ncbi:MAG: NAD(P)/FAD-dependent oxidoreductase, partial [Candidatus Bathyarchaeia archaeon]
HPVASRKLRNAKPSSIFGGIIPLHGPGERTFGDGFMIVGDAAAQTKSTSGGGIYFGMKAGRIAGQVAVEALERNDTSSKSLARFQRLCAESFGGELRFTSKIRRLLDRLGDNDLNTLLGILRSDDDAKSTIELHGDTSYQSKVWNPLLLKLAKASFTRPRGLGVLAKTMVLGLLDLTK